MKEALAAALLLFPLSLLGAQAPAEDAPPLRYEVDLSDHSDDLFHVTLLPGPLTAEDEHLDFVAFAPGVHSVLNFGRFVQSLQAFDAEGDELAVEKVHTNRWKLADPERVARIVYDIEDSFDTEIQEHRVIPCGGTGIEDDYVLLNTFGVLGYFERHLTRPVELRIEHDPEWMVGTALRRDRDGTYHASSYRTLADSPLLLGDLTTTGIYVGDIEVEIFVHSKVERLNADEVLFVAGEVLEAAERFIGFAPVDRYVFLMDFIDMETMQRNRLRSMGALEHSYSSMYTLPAFGSIDGLSRVVAHEFMHILTPLHLKSTVIANFDYSIPTTDRHLWLYEGITEWSADMLRLRGGMVDLERHLDILAGKIRAAGRFDPEYSLARLAMEWSTDEGLQQYGNIYQLGAVTGTLLDIRLLELSGGERGLREVFFEFVERYGKDEPFDDATFFDELFEATYPEIGEFFEAHVLDSAPLPYAEYFDKIGIAFEQASSGGQVSLTVNDEATAEELALREAWMSSLASD